MKNDELSIKRLSLWLVFVCMTALSLIPPQAKGQAERKAQTPVQSGVTVYDGPNGTVTYVNSPNGLNKVDYVLLPSHWNKCNITYKFVNSTSDLSVTDQRNAIRAAFATWVPYCGFTFTEISSGTADIEISWGTGNHGDAYPFDGPGGVLAHTLVSWSGSFTISAPIHFDDAETWKWDGTNYDLQTVALHEIGHAIGLDHSTVAAAVMYAYYPGTLRRALNQDDIDGISQVYSLISGSAVLCSGNNTTYSYSKAGASYYNWTVSSGLTILSGQGTSSIVVQSNGTSVRSTINVTTDLTCCSRTIVSGIPATPASVGTFVYLDDGIHCRSHASCSWVDGATSYVWTDPASMETVGLVNTASLIGGSYYNISVSAKNVCGTSTPRTEGLTTYDCSGGRVMHNNQNSGIILNADTKEISLSPNPASTSFEINLPGNESLVRIKMSNMAGQVIRDISTNEPHTIIQTSGIPAGLYIVNISSDNFNKISKMQIVK